ncbi:hypothetical protein NUW58_g10210 [Xylaria curta]|uniref:Uncharacterized protein n=1 Tax=Xylaria curta TaxID=42375 RepID=A0ACC1MPD6_9PEZI|nr:hypothetical protein NUW58_g10210 [Xylaria curta]
MRIATVAILAGSVALGKALDPSWSFASTTTITDEATLWYTVSVPFLTTVTTDVSGGADTITITKVFISIGTEPPNTILPTASTSDSATPYGDSISSTSFGPDGEVHFPPMPTKDLLGHLEYYRQPGITEDSDVLPSDSSTIASDGGDVTAYTASEDGTGTATDTTTAEQTTDSGSFAIPSRFIPTRPAIERSTTKHPSTPMRTSVQYDTRRFSRKYSTSLTAGFTGHTTTTSVASSGVDFNTGTYDETSGVSFTTDTFNHDYIRRDIQQRNHPRNHSSNNRYQHHVNHSNSTDNCNIHTSEVHELVHSDCLRL